MIKSLRGIVGNVLDCDKIVNVYELQSSNYVHFGHMLLGKA